MFESSFDMQLYMQLYISVWDSTDMDASLQTFSF